MYSRSVFLLLLLLPFNTLQRLFFMGESGAASSHLVVLLQLLQERIWNGFLRARWPSYHLTITIKVLIPASGLASSFHYPPPISIQECRCILYTTSSLMPLPLFWFFLWDIYILAFVRFLSSVAHIDSCQLPKTVLRIQYTVVFVKLQYMY